MSDIARTLSSILKVGIDVAVSSADKGLFPEHISKRINLLHKVMGNEELGSLANEIKKTISSKMDINKEMENTNQDLNDKRTDDITIKLNERSGMTLRDMLS